MIELNHISAGYGKQTVLKDVSAILEKGKLTSIIGVNGCGKSTLLKTVVRIHHHKSGEILVNERLVERLRSTELAKQVAYLPQSKKAPDITALKMVLHGRFAYLSYPRKYRPQDLEIARKSLAWAGLEDQADEMVSRLSGGMQQKVYIAMALAQDADTILMDEPTTYLDVAHQLRLMEMAKSLAREGKAVVMVLHDLSQALRVADEVIVMKDGRVTKSGTADEVFESGALQQAFGVQVERVHTASGWHYFCDSGVIGKGQ